MQNKSLQNQSRPTLVWNMEYQMFAIFNNFYFFSLQK